MISFIIPAHNEEAFIKETILSIISFAPSEQFEIIVSNNKSTDKTSEIAEANGAKVVESQDNTISGVRNTAVKSSSGDILVFLDADVRLTQQWCDNIEHTLTELRHNPMQITGFRCLPPQNGLWLNKYWFELMGDNSANYINSGHLITSKTMFDKLGGFNEDLNTAEDFDFCQRALRTGGSIFSNAKLLTIHDGYPIDTKQFVQRERWHGREDFETVQSTLESKVAILTIFHVLTLIITILLCLLTLKIEFALLYVCISLCTSMMVSLIKFKSLSVRSFLGSSLIAYLYFWGRSLALYDRLKGRYSNRIREKE